MSETSITRTERLIALFVIDQMGDDATFAEKSAWLRRAGFAIEEIGELLGLSDHAVSDILYKARHNSKKEKRAIQKRSRRDVKEKAPAADHEPDE